MAPALLDHQLTVPDEATANQAAEMLHAITNIAQSLDITFVFGLLGKCICSFLSVLEEPFARNNAAKTVDYSAAELHDKRCDS